MKKIFLIALVSTLTLLLAACGGGEGDADNISLADVVAAVEGAIESDSNMSAVDANYIKGSLGLEEGDYVEAVVKLTSVGTTIDEYGIFKAADADYAADIADMLNEYLQMRVDTWMGYLPEELPKLEGAEVFISGNYVMYAVLSEAEASTASSAFFDTLSAE